MSTEKLEPVARIARREVETPFGPATIADARNLDEKNRAVIMWPVAKVNGKQYENITLYMDRQPHGNLWWQFNVLHKMTDNARLKVATWAKECGELEPYLAPLPDEELADLRKWEAKSRITAVLGVLHTEVGVDDDVIADLLREALEAHKDGKSFEFQYLKVKR